MPSWSLRTAVLQHKDDDCAAGLTLTLDVGGHRTRSRQPNGALSHAHQPPALANEAVPKDVHPELRMAGLEPLSLRLGLLRVASHHDEPLDLAAVDLDLVRHAHAGNQPEAALLRVGLLVAVSRPPAPRHGCAARSVPAAPRRPRSAPDSCRA